MAALIGCKPEIVGEGGLELTLRFSNMREREAFKDAIRVARLTDDEFRAEYAATNGISQDTSASAE